MDGSPVPFQLRICSLHQPFPVPLMAPQCPEASWMISDISYLLIP